MMTAGMRASRVEWSHLVVSILSVERRLHRFRRNYFARSRASRTAVNRAIRRRSVRPAVQGWPGPSATGRIPANLQTASH
jgi:hypothetical protein